MYSARTAGRPTSPGTRTRAHGRATMFDLAQYYCAIYYRSILVLVYGATSLLRQYMAQLAYYDSIISQYVVSQYVVVIYGWNVSHAIILSQQASCSTQPSHGGRGRSHVRFINLRPPPVLTPGGARLVTCPDFKCILQSIDRSIKQTCRYNPFAESANK